MRIAEPTPTPQDTTPAPGTPRTMRGVREGGDEPEEGGALAWRVAAGGGELAVELFPWFLLRTTGMPVRLLDGLAGEEAGRLTDRVLAAERDIDDARRAFEANARAMREAVVRMEPVRRSRKIARHCLRAVREGVPLGEEEIGLLAQLGQAEWVARWEIAVAAAREAYGHAARAHARALAAARRRVAEAYDDDAVRHAVFVSNPGFHRAAGDGPLPREEDAGADRRSRLLIATVHRYLRRFATRCETVSFFGPTLHARLDPGEPAALLVGEPGPERVVVEASAWLADHLQDVLKRAAAPAGLRVWRSPVFREPPPEQGPAPGLERTLDGRRVRVPEPALRLWRAADGRRTLGELARELGLPVEEAVALARALGPAVIISWHRLPATELRPLTALSRAVRGDTTSGGVSGGVSVGASGGVSGGASGGAAAGAAGAALAALSELRSRYESAPWPVRAAHFEAAQAVVAGLGAQPRQGAGRHYADREIFHEDRSSPYSERVTIGGAALARLRDALSSVLPVCALAALLARQDARDALRAELAGRAAPLARLAVANLRADSPRLRALTSLLRDLVAAHADGAAPGARQTVRLSGRDVSLATAPLWAALAEEPAPPDDIDACLPSPDMMAVGPDLATATWLLSELHDDCGSIYGGLAGRLHSDPDGLWRGFLARAGRYVPPAGVATVVSRRRNAHVTPELPGLSIELSGLSGKPRGQTAPIADAVVPPTADAVEVAGRRYRLYPGDVAASPLHRALSLPALVPVPVDLGAHTPRIMIDDMIYQRERWRVRLPEERAEDPFERWLRLHRLKEAHGLPRHVFVRHPAEAKPFHVDFLDPLAVEDLARLDPAEVLVTEMLPTPGELWWRPGGEPQCAELRLGCFLRMVR